MFLTFVVCLLVNLLFLSNANCQDGSSELVPQSSTYRKAGNRRLRCTDENLRLYPNATACADEREPESCRMLFPTPSSTSPAARDPKCDNPLLADMTSQCRRTCAVCCENPLYACQNDNSGIVNCNENTEKCSMPDFSATMVKFCPATCGLCLAKQCQDQIEDCESMASLCTNELYAMFMEHQCAKTCGKCEPEKLPEDEEQSSEETEKPKPKLREKQTTSKLIETDDCIDIMKNCERNKKFCHNITYKDMMKINCAKTCGYCKPKRGRSSSTKSSTPNPECKDSHAFCKGWAANGYCESAEYSEEEKEKKCAMTCGYC